MKRDTIIKRAIAEVGTKEFPANSNDVIYNTWFYGHRVHGSAYPWCCAFVAWLFRTNQALFPRTASCANALEFYEAKSRIVTDPQPGDLVFFHFNTNARRTNHIGVVIGVRGDKLITIEGNTSINSDDNGGAVMKRERNRRHVVAFARPEYEEG